MRAISITAITLASMIISAAATPLTTRELTHFERAQLPPTCQCCCYPCYCDGDPKNTLGVKATPTARDLLNGN
jgi:hypothetical protein